MLVLAVALACCCAQDAAPSLNARRQVEVVTLQSVTMYDVWLWEREEEIDADEYAGADADYYHFGPPEEPEPGPLDWRPH